MLGEDADAQAAVALAEPAVAAVVTTTAQHQQQEEDGETAADTAAASATATPPSVVQELLTMPGTKHSHGGDGGDAATQLAGMHVVVSPAPRSVLGLRHGASCAAPSPGGGGAGASTGAAAATGNTDDDDSIIGGSIASCGGSTAGTGGAPPQRARSSTTRSHGAESSQDARALANMIRGQLSPVYAHLQRARRRLVWLDTGRATRHDAPAVREHRLFRRALAEATGGGSLLTTQCLLQPGLQAWPQSWAVVPLIHSPSTAQAKLRQQWRGSLALGSTHSLVSLWSPTSTRPSLRRVGRHLAVLGLVPTAHISPAWFTQTVLPMRSDTPCEPRTPHACPGCAFATFVNMLHVRRLCALVEFRTALPPGSSAAPAPVPAPPVLHNGDHQGADDDADNEEEEDDNISVDVQAAANVEAAVVMAAATPSPSPSPVAPGRAHSALATATAAVAVSVAAAVAPSADASGAAAAPAAPLAAVTPVTGLLHAISPASAVIILVQPAALKTLPTTPQQLQPFTSSPSPAPFSIAAFDDAPTGRPSAVSASHTCIHLLSCALD